MLYQWASTPWIIQTFNTATVGQSSSPLADGVQTSESKSSLKDRKGRASEACWCRQAGEAGAVGSGSGGFYMQSGLSFI